MLRAIILDFNGVILDDEPLHFHAMRDAVATIGISITREEYWSKYLPMDDGACLEAICRDLSVEITPGQRDEIIEHKGEIYRRLLRDQYPLFPGAARFIRLAAARYPLTLASGARRDEIESTLQATTLTGYFQVLIGAQDFPVGKPHPESYLFALRCLNEKLQARTPPILPRECLVVEDSIGGVDGARAAGMACLAVSNTYPRESLQAAHRVVTSLEEVNLEDLESIVKESC